MEFYDPALTLPPHRLIVQAVGDADRCPEAAAAAAAVVARSGAPIINRPEAVAATGRVENARRLAGIPGLRTARTQLYPRRIIDAPDAAERLLQDGFAFPLLLRAPGFHGGLHFERVETPAELAATVAALPGAALAAIEFLDARAGDGKIRKYRAVIVDGRLYPLHAAVSHRWKIHCFSADMAESAEHRAEDAAFLGDMARHVGPRAMHALEEICKTLALDYGGIDFGLDADGTVLLFEANATMVVPTPAADPRWSYRRAPAQRVAEAFHTMLLDRVAAAA